MHVYFWTSNFHLKLYSADLYYFWKGHTLSLLLIRLVIKLQLQLSNLDIWFSIFKCIFTALERPQEPSKRVTAFAKTLSYENMQEWDLHTLPHPIVLSTFSKVSSDFALSSFQIPDHPAKTFVTLQETLILTLVYFSLIKQVALYSAWTSAPLGGLLSPLLSEPQMRLQCSIFLGSH